MHPGDANEKDFSVWIAGEVDSALVSALESAGALVQTIALRTPRRPALPRVPCDVLLLAPGFDPEEVCLLTREIPRSDASDLPTLAAAIDDSSRIEALRAAGVIDFVWARDPGSFLVAALRAAAEHASRTSQLLRDRQELLRLLEAAGSVNDASFGEEPREAEVRKRADLAGRLDVESELGRALGRTPSEPRTCAVLYVDIDHFGDLNQRFGRATGDEILTVAAQRLRETIRASSRVPRSPDAAGHDRVGRLHGDEFALLLYGVRSQRDVATIAQRVLDALAKPIQTRTGLHRLSASVGIATSPADGSEAHALIRNACLAANDAKRAGRGRYSFFSRSGVEVDDVERARVSELREGLRGGQMRLYYQPTASCGSREVIGVEALIRWQHPVRGLLDPSEIIPLAEAHGLISELGIWVVENACRQGAEWLERGIEFGSISLNLSAKQFADPRLARDLIETIEASGLPTNRIEVEITESCLLDHERANAVLKELREAGLLVSIDDFGTGYSSLQYLRDLPIDKLKIDRSFVMRLDHDEAMRAMLVAIISLAWSLGLLVVAEGVETETQWEFLADHGCDAIQGFLLARPMTAEDCERMLARRSEPAEGSDT